MNEWAWVACLAMMLVTNTFLTDAAEDYYASARQRMVREQIVARGITNTAVVRAMNQVPRHLFVPNKVQAQAYEDRPLPIGEDQTISQPYIVGFMTEALQLAPGEKVLEVGTGSGYQAAILAAVGAKVFSIEIVKSLADRAALDLKRFGYTNVVTRHGDGYKGWPEEAPFDAIIVTCAPESLPEALKNQLRDGGRMIIPVGAWSNQQLYLLRKSGKNLEQKAVLPVRFVPMTRGGGSGSGK